MLWVPTRTSEEQSKGPAARDVVTHPPNCDQRLESRGCTATIDSKINNIEINKSNKQLNIL